MIAADHAATRTGVRLALGPEADCSEAGDAESAVAAAVRHRPDVCLVDFAPADRGIRAAAEITARVPDASVVLMTPELDEEEFLAALRAGAVGYLTAGVDPARLPYVVRSLMRGEAIVPRRLVSRLIDEVRGRELRRRRLVVDDSHHVELTGREWEVLELLRQGNSTRRIAELLGINSVTVRRHISAVQQKLGSRTRAELLSRLDATDVESIG